MTACVNRKHTKKVAAVVTASLVGALSLGAAPVAAVADTGIDTLESAPAKDSFSNGTLKLYGNSHTYDGKVFAPSIDGIQTKTGAWIDGSVINSSDDYKVYYVKADAKGQPTDELVGQPVDAGSYCIVVEAVSGDWEGGKVWTGFSISGKSLVGAVAYEGTDTMDTTFTYDAESAEVNFKASDETKLRNGVDYTVKYYKIGEDWSNPANGSETAPTDAGNYYARLTGINAYSGTVNVEFSIGKYTLAAADVYTAVTVGEATPLPTAPTTVKGSEELAKHFKLGYASTPGAPGAYAATVSLVNATADAANIDVTGTVTTTVYKVKFGASFTYGADAMPSEMTVNLDKKESFDVSKVAASYVDGNGDTQEIAAGAVTGEAGKWTMVATRPDGSGVTSLSDLDTPGTYILTFTANPDASCTYGGSFQLTLHVVNGTVDCASDMYVSYDIDNDGVKEVVTSLDVPYSGSDIMGGIDVKVFCGDTEVTGACKLTFTDAEGNTVSQIKNAGTYKLTVTSDNYIVENGTFDITVNKLQVSDVRIMIDENGMTYGALEPINGRYALNYTGNVISPIVQYTDGTRNADGTIAWKNLVGSIVEDYAVVAYAKDGAAVKQVKELGDYTLTVTASSAAGSENFEFTADAFDFAVATSLKFVDVAADQWYYDVVNKAADNGYVNGYSNSKLFGPMDYIKRGDVACILFNMAGGDNSYEGYTNEMGGFETGFSDVDSTKYYAKAIQWAKNSGVVNGYGDGTFAPEQNVTREEFAAMLSNYASKMGDDVDGAEADLSKFDDASQISDWATEAVEWAVANEVMGNGGFIAPTSTITRAEVAAMAVNYQPAKLPQA